jgi:RHS repeat-associated protein
MKDHLGNIRLVFAAHDNGQPEVLQQTSYYPYGKILQQQNFHGVDTRNNKNLFNGKEFQDDVLAGISVDWYDFGARMYDPEICRWHVMDPMAVLSPNLTPYRFGFNNPISFTDPNGMYEEDRIPPSGGIYDEYDGPESDYYGPDCTVSAQGSWRDNPPFDDFLPEEADLNDIFFNPVELVDDFESTSFLYSDEMNYIGLGLSGLGIISSSITHFGNLSTKMNLLNSKQFLANYNGVSKVWNLNFKGSQYVSTSLVTAQKSRFLTNVKLLSGMKYLGVATSILGTGISIAQFKNTNNTALKFEYGFDIGMSVVGFYGLPGAAASGLYFAGKPLMKENAYYNVQATSGYSDVAKGQYNLMILPFK